MTCILKRLFWKENALMISVSKNHCGLNPKPIERQDFGWKGADY